jgi:perosamine synthetase
MTDAPTRPPITAARLVFSAGDRAEILAMIDESLQTGALTLGPRTAELEAAFGARHEAPHAVATSSGTSALEIILRHLDLRGREVVVPTNTFFATAAAVHHAGGRPRLADVGAETFTLTPATIEAAIGPATAGVIVVHIGGAVTPDMPAIRKLCDDRGIFCVEDAAHAHGADLDGRPAGTFGHAGAFSFYPTKVITSAEGGMIVTSDQALADDARIYRDQGKAGFLGGDHVRMGYAWRLSELQAAVGIVQLRRLDEFVSRRREVAARYDEALLAIGGISPVPAPPGSHSSHYKYLALLDPGIDRDTCKRRMRDEHGVSCSGEVYAKPLHLQPIFADGAATSGPFPVAEDLCARHICLPIHSDMRDDETERVVTAVHDVLATTPREP